MLAMKILVVDDNRYILALIQNMLKGEGFKIELCSHVDDAVDVLEQGGDVDLVITDVIMPEKDGAKLAEYVRAKSPSTPILAITGGIENAVEDYVNYGAMFADEAIAKPVSKDTLLTTIKKLTKAA